MNAITKEQLIERLQHIISVASEFPESEKAQIDLELARIALASLESEAAQVVPEEMTPQQASRSYGGEVRGYRDGWNDCRAAMLQCADGSLAHEGKNHPEDKLGMVDHFGGSNNMVEPVTDNTNQQFESLSRGDK